MRSEDEDRAGRRTRTRKRKGGSFIGHEDAIAVRLIISHSSRPADSTEGHLAATRRRMRSEDEVEEEDEVEDAGG